MFKTLSNFFADDRLKFLIPGFALTLVGFWVAYQFVNPAPPRRITMATGGEGGAYSLFGQRYRDILAREQVTLEVRHTAGSGENIALLQAAQADVAFVQSGVGDDAAKRKSGDSLCRWLMRINSIICGCISNSCGNGCSKFKPMRIRMALVLRRHLDRAMKHG